MRLLVYVDDQLIQLYPGTLIAFTYQNTFLSNLSTRRVSYTNEISAPFTPQNDLIFGFARLEKSNAAPAYRRLSAKIIRNGHTLPITNCQIERTEEDYKLVFFDSLKEFMDLIADSTIDQLKDIDSEFVTWDAAEMDERRNSTSGLVSPVLSYGQIDLQVLRNTDFTSGGDFIDGWEQVNIAPEGGSSPYNDKQFADDGTSIHAELNSYSIDDGSFSYEQPGGTVLLRQPFKFYAGQTYTVTLRHSYNSGGPVTPTRGKLILLKDESDRLGRTVLDEQSQTTATTDTETFTPLNGSDQPESYNYFAIFGLLPPPTPSPGGNTDSADFYVYSVSVTMALDMTSFANLPSVYYKSIFQAIYESVGYSVEQTALFSDDIYTKMIVPFSKGEFKYTGFFNDCREFEAEIQTPVTISADQDIAFETIIKKDLFGYYNPTTGDYDTDAANVYQPVETADNRAFFAKFYATLDVTLISGQVKFSMRSQGFGEMVEQTITSPGRYLIKLVANEYQQNSLGFLLEGGDVVFINADFLSAGSFRINSGSFYNSVDGTNHEETDPSFYAAELLPDMKQKEFVTDLLLRFGIVPFEKNKLLTLKTIDEIISDRSGALDWTNKRDKSVKDEVIYNNQYAQNNYFTYPSNDDFFFERPSRGNIKVDNENLPPEGTIYESVFNGSTDISVEASGANMYVAYIPVNDSAKVNYPTYSNDVDLDHDPGLRLMVVRSKRSSEPSVEYNGNSRSDYLIANFLKPDARELSWEEFINRFFSRALKAIQMDKTIIRSYSLSEADIAQVHPHKIIYDNGSYFWLEQIPQHVDRQSVRCRLYKIV